MAVFFQRETPMGEAVKDALEDALMTDPAQVPEPSSEAQTRALALQRQTAARLSWGRLAVAVLLLAGILVASIYCAQNDKLQDLYRLLLHSFELILGAVVGLLTGEAISH